MFPIILKENFQRFAFPIFLSVFSQCRQHFVQYHV